MGSLICLTRWHQSPPAQVDLAYSNEATSHWLKQLKVITLSADSRQQEEDKTTEVKILRFGKVPVTISQATTSIPHSSKGPQVLPRGTQ